MFALFLFYFSCITVVNYYIKNSFTFFLFKLFDHKCNFFDN